MMNPSPSTPTPAAPERLVLCFECGYMIPNEIGGRCPECGEVWTQQHQARQILREEINEGFPELLKKSLVRWFVVLLVYAVGAQVAAGVYSGQPFLYAFFGIGFGVVTSVLLGLLITRIDSEHQRRMLGDAWLRSLWWFHGPWLLIGPLTIIGCVPALIFRVIDPHIGEGVMVVVVLAEFALWAIGVFMILVAGFIKLDEHRQEMDIRNYSRSAMLHSLFALAIWLGSCIVGFFGGMLGAYFKSRLLDPHPYDF